MGNPDSSILCPKCYTWNSGESDRCNKCDSPLEENQDTLSISSKVIPAEGSLLFSPGEHFGTRYRIVEEIGRGGMGRVYKAKDLELNITVALKVISPKYSSNPRFIERFKKEVLSARSISHENIIRIFDLGEEQGIKYFSMEYIKGQNLRNLMRTSGPLTTKRAIEIIRQICYALKAAHNRGIIHRDLKPSNIMIDNNGQAYVMDFGLAKSISGLEPERPKTIEGTPKYMSPEQIHKGKLDHRTDIYSLGLIFYEMLTGQPAFDADSETEYFHKQVKDFPRLPTEINPDIPPTISAIITKCLAKDKADRPESVEDILEFLSEEDTGTSTQIKPKKKVRSLPGIAAAALILIVATYFLIWKSRPSEVSPAAADNRMSLAIVYLENNTGDKSLDYLCREFTNLLIFDLLQSKYIRPLTPNRIVDLHSELDLVGSTQYSTADLQRLAQRGSVDYVLWGSLHKPADVYTVNLLLYRIDPWGDIGSTSSQGILVPTIVDDLSYKIKRALNLSATMIANDIDRKVEDIITASPEALDFYFQGSSLYEELKYRESNEALFQAVEIDPGFAMAYRKISLNFDYLRDAANSKKYLEKAMENIDRVSDREKYLIRGYYGQQYSHSVQEPIQAYEELLKIYPDDIDGNIQLGSFYRNIEEWDKALDRWEKVLSIESANLFGIQNKGYILQAKGLYDSAREFLEANKHGYISQAAFHRTMSQLNLKQGKLKDALLEIEEVRKLDPENVIHHRIRGHIHQVNDEWEAAEREYQFLVEHDGRNQQLRGHLWKSRLLLAQGKLQESREEANYGLKGSREHELQAFEQDFLLLLAYLNIQLGAFDDAVRTADQAYAIASELLVFDRMWFAMLLKGLAYLESNEVGLAENTAVELRTQIESSACLNFMRIYHLLMGLITINNGEPALALDYLEMAYNALPHQKAESDNHALYLDTLAAAAEMAGMTDKAQSYLESLLSLTTGKLKWGDIYVLGHYRLGKIYQNKGMQDEAVEKYQQFLKLWKDADYGQPQRLDAEKQLDSIRNSAVQSLSK